MLYISILLSLSTKVRHEISDYLRDLCAIILVPFPRLFIEFLSLRYHLFKNYLS